IRSPISSGRSSPPASSTWNFCATNVAQDLREAVLLCDNLVVRWIGVEHAPAHRRALASGFHGK
ncbi:MAG: hypothetical protein WAK86_11940, partial [Pseudonocardiaceae bacterium]